MNNKVIGYKAFDSNFRCNGMQFEVGKTYRHDGEIRMSEAGFQFYENPLDVFICASPDYCRFAVVEAGGEISKDSNQSYASELHIKAELSLQQLIDAGAKYIYANNKRKAAVNSGDWSVAVNSGAESSAINSGYQSTAVNSGYRSAAVNSGEGSVAFNSGDGSVAVNSGDWSVAVNAGYKSAAANSGDASVAVNSGHHESMAVNSGNQSVAINTASMGMAAVEGAESIAMAAGPASKAKGALGCWLVLSEWDKSEQHRINVVCVRVDGKRIKTNTFYSLRKGKIVEVNK
jgi:hypothetical protein